MTAAKYFHQKGGELARLAGMLCAKSDFQHFLGVVTPAAAADRVRSLCGVSSRADLDHSPDAAGKFHSLVRKPYLLSKEPHHG